MRFKLIPILDVMIELYSEPDLSLRFNKYLKLLQGNDANDMQLPISGYNPMSKQNVMDYLLKLREINIEEHTKGVIDNINELLKSKDDFIYTIVINICDHQGGAWTQRYTTDYDNKFRNEGFLKRKFCPLYLWVNELITNQIIEQRITSTIYRTVYQTKYGEPLTLEQHIQQETFANTNGEMDINQLSDFANSNLAEFYSQYKSTEDYNLIFNFLYGDQASETIGYRSYGIRSEKSYLASKILIES